MNQRLNLLFLLIISIFSFNLSAEEYKGLPQFDTSKYSQQIFWLVIIFGILFLTMSYIIIPAFKKIKHDRHVKISSYIDNALKVKKNIENIDTTLEKKKLDLKNQILSIENDNINNISNLNQKKNNDLTNIKNQMQADYNEMLLEIKNNFQSIKNQNISEFTNIILKKLNIKSKG